MYQTREDSIKKLKELIDGIDFAMLTTISDGRFHSRPMSTQEFESDGSLWFFTSDQTYKVENIKKDNRVNVAYSKPETNSYVSVSGTAESVKDRAKIEELWSPLLKAWFPRGLEDPTLTLLKISIEQAEYWDSSNSALVQIAGFIKAIATGKQIEGGDHGKVSF